MDVQNNISDLERRKLELEIEKLNKKLWQNPSFWTALFPTILALATLFIAYFNGVFDVKIKELEITKKNLAHDIKIFENQKSVLEKEIAYKTSKLDSLKNEHAKNQNLILYYKTSLEELTEKNEILEETLNKTKSIKNLTSGDSIRWVSYSDDDEDDAFAVVLYIKPNLSAILTVQHSLRDEIKEIGTKVPYSLNFKENGIEVISEKGKELYGVINTKSIDKNSFLLVRNDTVKLRFEKVAELKAKGV